MKKSLQENIYIIQQEFANSKELIVKEISTEKNKCAVIYLLGITDTIALSKLVISPVLECKIKLSPSTTPSKLPLAEIESESDNKKIISAILKGKGILIIDGYEDVLVLAIDKFKERALAEPPTSTVLKGPREGFVESIKMILL